MKIIADSSSTRTEWAMVEGDRVVEHATTEGLNPILQTRREISHSVRLGLPPVFFRGKLEHVWFYGAGCVSPAHIKTIESSLVAQFRTPVTVQSDLLGAARGLLLERSGIACIMGTGSNSCLYDGHAVTQNIRSLGFILGDEGSGADIGKRFISDWFKGITPQSVVTAFADLQQLDYDRVLDEVYSGPFPNRVLAAYARTLANLKDDPYVHALVSDSMRSFFDRNVARYDGASKLPLNVVGSIAVAYSDILTEIAGEYGFKVGQIIPSSMPGLIKYHSIEHNNQ